MSAFIILIKNMARKTSIFISEEQKQNIIKAYTTDNLTTTEICRMGLFKKYPLLSYEDYEKYRLIFEDYTK